MKDWRRYLRFSLIMFGIVVNDLLIIASIGYIFMQIILGLSNPAMQPNHLLPYEKWAEIFQVIVR